MATEKQFEANRLNAQKSTGPKTPEGRAAVRLNGVTHGLTAETIVLKGESQADFTNMLESFEAEHAPTTPTEEAFSRAIGAGQLATPTSLPSGSRLLHLRTENPRVHPKGSQSG